MKSSIYAVLVGLLLVLASASPASAETGSVVPKDVSYEQRLGERVPLDATFRDEAGKEVRLGEYFQGKKPVVLALAYYECPMLCTMVLNGLTASLKGMKLSAGVEFEVVAVSFDPREGPELARQKKASYLKLYGRPGAESGVHFLTGEKASIDALTSAVGFRYAYDETSKQFAHAAGIVVLTPDGVVSKYFYGIDFPSTDLRLALVESAKGNLGTLSDRMLLLCFQYDPARGRYTMAALNSVRVGAALTVIALAASIFAMSRRRPTRRAGERGEP